MSNTSYSAWQAAKLQSVLVAIPVIISFVVIIIINFTILAEGSF